MFHSRRLRSEKLEQRCLLAELSGFVYIDSNNNGVRNAVETGIPGVIIELTGTDTGGNTIQLQALTAQDGSYAFVDLEPGDYQIRQIQPESFRDGQEEIGSQGGVANDDLLEITGLLAEDVGRNNNFGELGLAQGFFSKRFFLATTDTPTVFRDLNANAVERNGDINGANDIRDAAIPSIVSSDGVTPITPNRTPDLDPIADQQVVANQQLAISLSASDPDGDQLTFIVDEDDSPANAEIVDDGAGPELRFTPSDAQAGQTLEFRVLVIDDGEPPLSDAEEFSVIVQAAQTVNAVAVASDDDETQVDAAPSSNSLF